MATSFQRCYAGLHHCLPTSHVADGLDRTPLFTESLIAHGRIPFLPLILRERDAGRIHDLIRRLSSLDRPREETSTPHPGEDLLTLIQLLWDAAQFSKTHGILVLTCPEDS